MTNYVRNCPKCETVIEYKTKKYYVNSVKHNRTCKNCRPIAKSTRHWLGKIHSDETKQKMSMTHRGKVGPNRGKKFSEETKNKMRLAAINRIQINSGQCSPRYNPSACKIFNELNHQFGWNGLHAENGGEYHIKELGFWVDFYEPTLNLVIEYDEKYHSSPTYMGKDEVRELAIKDLLNCKFVRIKESDDVHCIRQKIKEVL